MFEWMKPEPEPPVLDSAYLARLAGHLGQTMLDELLADGLIELTDRVARIAELSAAGDREGLRRLGHDIVGMAGHLGLSRLSATAAQLGRALRREEGDGIWAAADLLCHEGGAATTALRSYLAR